MLDGVSPHTRTTQHGEALLFMVLRINVSHFSPHQLHQLLPGRPNGRGLPVVRRALVSRPTSTASRGPCHRGTSTDERYWPGAYYGPCSGPGPEPARPLHPGLYPTTARCARGGPTALTLQHAYRRALR